MEISESEQSGRAGSQLRFTSNVLRSLGIINDVVCFTVAFVLACLIYNLAVGQYFDYQFHATGAIVMAINFFLLRISRDGYTAFRGQDEDLGKGTNSDFILAAVLTAFTIFQFDLMADFSRALGLLFVALSLIMLFLSRITFRRLAWRLMDAGHIGQRIAIYGAGKAMVTRVIELLEIEQLPHVKIIGFSDDRGARADASSIDGIKYLGGFDQLLALAQAGKLDQVILALPQVNQERLDLIAEQLSAAAIDVCILPRESLELRTSYRVNFLGSLPVFSVWQQPVRDIDGVIKALQDRALACIGIVLLSPLLVLTAIAIKLETKGPVIFVQKRFGFNNSEIGVFKFRSMRTDLQDISGAQRTTKDDPRVTWVGKIIRRTSIDELPQLFNVLRGEMSIVGPRPHATQMRVGDKYYFDAVKGYAARHRVKPGITGLAQIRGLRGEIATVERAKKRVEYDVYYIENWSPLLDIRIILETVLKIAWDKHAY